MPVSPVVAQLIMGAKAPDVYKSYQQGQITGQTMRDLETTRIREDEERKRAEETRRIMGGIVSQKFQKDSEMAALGFQDPEAALQLAEKLNIPMDQSGRFQAFGKNVLYALEAGQQDPQATFQHMQNYSNRLGTMGVAAEQTNEWLMDFQKDPEAAMKDLAGIGFAFNQVFGTPEKAGKKTDTMLHAEAMNLEPGTPEYVSYIKAQTAKEKKEFELKNKNLQVINSLASKIKAGAASTDEIRKYTLAESDYTMPRQTVEPSTGLLSLTQPALPKGFPTFKGAVKGKKEDGAKPQEVGHKEPLLSTGEFTIKPISDPKAISRAEIVKYRTSANSLVLMKEMLTELKTDIEKNGVFPDSVKTYTKRKSQYTDILMRYKEVLNLGVLNGPDIEQMQKIIKDSTDVGSIALGKDWVIPGYENVLKSLDRELIRMYDVTGGTVGIKKTDKKPPKDIPTINTQKEFDALPSGATYYDEGVEYRKP